jgi:hypothetical protein
MTHLTTPGTEFEFTMPNRGRTVAGIIVVVLLLQFGIPGSAVAQNFTGGDAELLSVAEQSRIQSAMFWTGSALPGRWYKPCPISVERPVAAGASTGSRTSGTGKTVFRIADGEVFGWKMSVAGPRQSILQDVVPHEVDHMVRATLVRRPIVRWLDEGSAALQESPEAHRQLRDMIHRDPGFEISQSFLEGTEYPADSVHLTRLYAGGFSAVEFLLERGGPKRLLDLQRSDRSTVEGLQSIYGLSADEFQTAWRAWFVEKSKAGLECRQFGCEVHRVQQSPWGGCDCRTSPENLLTVASANWCIACRRFWSDFETNSQFRNAILSRFHVHRVDVDRPRPGVSIPNVTTLPTFLAAGIRIEGYAGPEWLLERLTPDRETTPPDNAAPQPPAPAAEPAPEETSQPPPPAETAPPPVAAEEPLSASASKPAATVGGVIETAAHAAPIVLSLLQLAGIVGGTVATGGVGGLVLAAALAAFRRRRSAKTTSATQTGEVGASAPAPFPRHLDEARQLLELRQSEGRVAALDALRGMFLDDEAGKALEGTDAAEKAAIIRLMGKIDARVGEVAPLATTVEE